jgi:Anti-sigma-K factor rskA/Putative zinc-finger
MNTLSHEQCEDLLPGYLLGTLTPDETAAVAEHLHSCAQCQASQSAYEMVLDRLCEAVDLQAPPPAVQQRLLSLIEAEPPPLAAARVQTRRGRWGGRVVAVWAAVSIVLCLGLGWWTWTTWQIVTRMRANEQALVRQLDIQRQALALLTAPGSRSAILSAEGSQSRGVLLLQETASEAVLIARDLPPLKANRVYQLWLLREGVRDNGGVFQVDPRGFGMLHIQAPLPFATYRAAGITEEPSGGSPGPTSPRVIGGPLKQ